MNVELHSNVVDCLKIWHEAEKHEITDRLHKGFVEVLRDSNFPLPSALLALLYTITDLIYFAVEHAPAEDHAETPEANRIMHEACGLALISAPIVLEADACENEESQ